MSSTLRDPILHPVQADLVGALTHIAMAKLRKIAVAMDTGEPGFATPDARRSTTRSYAMCR